MADRGGGAGDEVRTRDMQLGRLPLCQLSYSRPVRPFERQSTSRDSSNELAGRDHVPSIRTSGPLQTRGSSETIGFGVDGRLLEFEGVVDRMTALEGGPSRYGPHTAEIDELLFVARHLSLQDMAALDLMEREHAGVLLAAWNPSEIDSARTRIGPGAWRPAIWAWQRSRRPGGGRRSDPARHRLLARRSGVRLRRRARRAVRCLCARRAGASRRGVSGRLARALARCRR